MQTPKGKDAVIIDLMMKGGMPAFRAGRSLGVAHVKDSLTVLFQHETTLSAAPSTKNTFKLILPVGALDELLRQLQQLQDAEALALKTPSGEA